MKTKEQSRLFACKMRNMLLLLTLVSWFFRLQPAMNVLAAENSAGFAGGNGTKEAPYQVSTPEQLNHVRNALDAYFIQTQDIDMTGETA